MRASKHYLFQIILTLGVTVSLQSCSSKPASKSDTNSIKFQQYYIAGEQLFVEHCSNCHQKNGKGLGLLYPPVDKSDFMDKNFDQVLCLIRNGIKGEIGVNGNSYNKEMPPIPSLTDLEIAEITTYLYNTWGRDRGLIEVKDASKILGVCPE